MSYGFSVYDVAGNLQIDSSRRYLRVHSIITYTFTASPYVYQLAIPVPGFTQDGSWHAACWFTDINTSDQITYQHTLYVVPDNYVGVTYAGRNSKSNININYPSTGVLAVYRI